MYIDTRSKIAPYYQKFAQVVRMFSRCVVSSLLELPRPKKNGDFFSFLFFTVMRKISRSDFAASEFSQVSPR